MHEGEVGKTAALIEVGLVDEVPSALETIGALNIISKSSTFSKGMIGLALSQRGMGFGKTVELSKGVCESSWVFSFENSLCVPRH